VTVLELRIKRLGAQIQYSPASDSIEHKRRESVGSDAVLREQGTHRSTSWVAGWMAPWKGSRKIAECTGPPPRRQQAYRDWCAEISSRAERFRQRNEANCLPILAINGPREKPQLMRC